MGEGEGGVKQKRRTGTSKANHVNEDSCTVRCVCAAQKAKNDPRGGWGLFPRRCSPEINAIRVPVPPIPFKVIQVSYAVVTFSNKIVFCDLYMAFGQSVSGGVVGVE